MMKSTGIGQAKEIRNLIVLMVAITTTTALTSGAELNAGISGSQESTASVDTSGRIAEGFRLSTRLEKPEVSIGESVRLILTLKNVSEEYRPLGGLLPEEDYKLDIKNERGESAPLTEYGRQLLEKERSGSQASLDLAAGQKSQYTILVNTLYDLTAPGTYCITARRQVPRLDRRKVYTEVISNTVKLKVREGFQLSARLENQEVNIGEPIMLELSIRNSTDRELAIEEIGAEKEYKLDVRDERGERVPVTEEGQRLIDNEGNDTMVVGVRIRPGQERTDVIEVSRLYQMVTSGTYSITARRKVRKLDHTGWIEVVSNTVTISRGY